MKFVSAGDYLEWVFSLSQEHHHSCFPKFQVLHHQSGELQNQVVTLGNQCCLECVVDQFLQNHHPFCQEVAQERQVENHEKY